MKNEIRVGSCLDILRCLPENSIQSCVTSPPYFGLRDYGVAGQMGLEPTLAEYISNMTTVFREVRRVLREDGTLWLNIGDSYARTGGTDRTVSATAKVGSTRNTFSQMADCKQKTPPGTKEKDLLMVPARLAIALCDDGWYLRSDIIWHKPNPMPESVTDRPTSAHEHVFLLTKSPLYFYDYEAMKEPSSAVSLVRLAQNVAGQTGSSRANGGAKTNGTMKAVGGEMRNARNVWSITTKPFKGAHFATMPIDLATRCIRGGTRTGDTVLDPFGGAGTTAIAANRLNRGALLIELNPKYADLARKRISSEIGVLPLDV